MTQHAKLDSSRDCMYAKTTNTSMFGIDYSGSLNRSYVAARKYGTPRVPRYSAFERSEVGAG